MDNREDPAFFAERFGLQSFPDVTSFPFVKKKIHKLPYSFVKQKLALPIDEQEGKLVVAIAHPFDLEVLEEIRFLTGQEIQEVFCPKEPLEEAIEKCYHQKEKEASQFIEGLKKEKATVSFKEKEDEYDLLDKQEDSPVVRLLNMILTEAIQQGASDIHFEPSEDQLTIRYRIDGVLQFRHHPPPSLSKQLLTRVKVIAKMDIAEHRLPQDGRIKLAMGGRQIDFRASTIPVVYGERVVLRILDKSHVVLGLDRIGMGSRILEAFRKYIHQNQGIVLVTGPTGSGKTTTLYSAVNESYSEEINIMTIEDPVEYKLSGIAQMGVNPKIGLTFAKGLRHILRQDPDVMMIGEIRDKETAEIAIQSSLTGHLVLSTLHTNDAPSALTRLVDMGMEPYLLSSSILAVLAQRLVRKICPDCKERDLNGSQECHSLSINSETFYRGRGCKACLGSGYRGRLGVYELMPMSSALKKELLLNVDASALQQTARREGMETLREAGMTLASQGITTVAEVLRVTRGLDF